MIHLVIPVFNEADRWNHEYFSEIAAILGVEMLFVNDGSTDGSALRISNLISSHTNIGALNLDRNVGKAEAVRVGLNHILDISNAQIVGFLDSDGAFSIEDIRKTIDLALLTTTYTSNTWWWTSRLKTESNHIERTLKRHMIGRVVAGMLTWRRHQLPYDTQAGFKLFTVSNSFRTSLQSPFRTRWFVDLEIYYRTKSFDDGFPDVIEVPLSTWIEISNSKLGLRDLFRVLNEIMIIKKMQ